MHKPWRILEYLKPYLPVFTIAFLLMGMAAGFEGLRILLLRPIFDNILANALFQTASRGSRIEIFTLPFTSFKVYLDQLNFFRAGETWQIVGWLIIVTTFVKGLAEWLSTYLLNYMGQSVVMTIRNRLYSKILNQSSSFFHSHSTGRLISRVTNDVEKIQFAASTNLADALKQGLNLAVFLAIIFYADWKLAFGSILIAPVIIWPSKYIGKKIRKSSRSSQDKMGEISDILQETITGHRIVKAFGMEAFEREKFRQATGRLARINLSWIRVHSITSPYMDLIAAITITLMLYYCQQRISLGQMTTGKFVVFMGGLIQLYEPIRRISGIYNSFQQARGATGKVFDLLDEQSETVEKPRAIIIRQFSREVEFRNVSFNYNDSHLPVLQEVSLTIKRGEVVALVGSSGSGKTTLVNLLPRFFDPSDGQILIDGIDIRDLSLASLRSLMGLVTQETILFNDTARNNICYGRDKVTDEEVLAASKAALAHDFIEQMPQQYQSVIGERGQKLSGGERQRIAIARALLKNSPILILDEATSALDSESEILVQKALSNLMQGRTVIVIAHRLSTIRRADKIVVLDQGQICEVGTHADLVERGGVYQRLHDLQFAEIDSTWVV
ncbi:MAG TPA: ABC transporter transmembrane domain-containing protein [Terriglobia bacterium]|nr:ABC transporter transmembrane domain-containing protein [Terriglobia bacterium]